jgi:hypothetical protein
MILYIDEERDDRSFIMGAEIVSWGWNSTTLFSKYECVGNMKPPPWLAEADNEHGAMDTIRGKDNEHTWWYGQWTHMKQIADGVGSCGPLCVVRGSTKTTKTNKKCADSVAAILQCFLNYSDNIFICRNFFALSFLEMYSVAMSLSIILLVSCTNTLSTKVVLLDKI